MELEKFRVSSLGLCGFVLAQEKAAEKLSAMDYDNLSVKEPTIVG